ncbi:squalene/phytoene synthase family protein [Pseudalkalibacillus hwajinpoensis]|uniref:phytoene/squalene synthase family protein n=1 Tax=Guptibacillus hwajinpoensis TaxID=208199 RepID=UPI00325AA2EB
MSIFGMQITNILRGISEDLERKRIYLPINEMIASGYMIDDLLNRRLNKEFIDVWKRLANRAESHYEKAFSAMDLYPLDARLPVKSSAVLYRAILKSIRKKGYNVFEQRAFVTDKDKKSFYQLSQEANNSLKRAISIIWNSPF